MCIKRIEQVFVSASAGTQTEISRTATTGSNHSATEAPWVKSKDESEWGECDRIGLKISVGRSKGDKEPEGAGVVVRG